MTLLDFHLIIIITVTIQVAVFNWFSWNSHGWCQPKHGWTLFCFGNNQSNRTTDMGENMPPKLVFWLSFSWYGGFWGKNFEAVFGTPFPIIKVIHFCHPASHSVKNGYAAKNIFLAVILENIIIIILNCYIKNIQNLISYKKGCTDFCRQMPPFPQNGHVLPQMVFHNFFNLNWRTFGEVFLLETILVQRKILWRINFVLMKCLPNAVLFEKLQNECKNPSFLDKVTCIRWNHAGAGAKFHIHGFILQEAFILYILYTWCVE